MRTVTKETTLYKFDELSESAKETAINSLRDVNVCDDWWEFVYDDAENIGLKIDGFGIERDRHANGSFIQDANLCASRIVESHGEMCETYKTAKAFLSDWAELVTKYSDGINTDEVAEGNEYEFDQGADELEKEFLKSLLEDYAISLEKEYEYLTSDEAILSFIESMEYEFTEDGEEA